MPGKVYLIGAGPGDPGLLTLKGRAILERADCVIYDFLAAGELLRFCRPDAEKIFAGQARRWPASSAGRDQSTSRRQGARVCRRGPAERRRPVRLRPRWRGSASTGQSRNRIRGCSGRDLGHRRAGLCRNSGDAPRIRLLGLVHRRARRSGEGRVGHRLGGRGSEHRHAGFLHGHAQSRRHRARLVERGRPPATPAAVIRWGSRPGQQVVAGTLADIATLAAGLQPPTVIVVGEVVRLRDELNWFERLPLFGKRIVITRTREQAGALAMRSRSSARKRSSSPPSKSARPPPGSRWTAPSAAGAVRLFAGDFRQWRAKFSRPASGLRPRCARLEGLDDRRHRPGHGCGVCPNGHER